MPSCLTAILACGSVLQNCYWVNQCTPLCMWIMYVAFLQWCFVTRRGLWDKTISRAYLLLGKVCGRGRVGEAVAWLFVVGIWKERVSSVPPPTHHNSISAVLFLEQGSGGGGGGGVCILGVGGKGNGIVVFRMPLWRFCLHVCSSFQCIKYSI